MTLFGMTADALVAVPTTDFATEGVWERTEFFIADLSHERIKRGPIFGGLINEYEPAAWSRRSASVAEFWNPTGLVAARKRIALLEAELALTRDACALFDEQEVVVPKGTDRSWVFGTLGLPHYSVEPLLSGSPPTSGLWPSHPQDHRLRRDRKDPPMIPENLRQAAYPCGAAGGPEMIVNLKLVAALMRELGVSGLPRQRKRKPNLLGTDPSADLVQRNFTASRPNELWFTDISEIPSGTDRPTAARFSTISARLLRSPMVFTPTAVSSRPSAMELAFSLVCGGRSRRSPSRWRCH
jgi:hypothetical protein